MNRRQLLLGAASAAVFGGVARTASAEKMIMPWDYVNMKDKITNTDGTPLQFMPKKPADPDPLSDELKKYAICPYCGMSRTKFSHTRHLIHYEDDLVDGTCSIHCASISLAINMDRGPKAIYVGDAGSDEKIKPLISVEKAFYAIDPSKMGTMSGSRKYAYADKAKAQAAGGSIVGFDDALKAAYGDMATNTILIRKRRAEKRRKAIK